MHTNEPREYVAKASLRHIRMSPQRLRLVLNLIQGKQVEPALKVLDFTPKKGAQFASKLLRSAIANAREHRGADVDKLWVIGGYVDAAPSMKRIFMRARGSADRIAHRASHMTLFVGER